MLFNSLEFPLFLAMVVMLFHLVNNNLFRQYLLLGASLFFYGYWKWSYLVLLLASSSIDYWAAIQIGQHEDQKKKRLFLLLSLAGNLSILLFFKYGKFLGESFFADDENLPAWLNVVLPVGISFYTFQAMGYVVDVYRNRLPAEKSYSSFLLFITFFPQLVAGPIERAPHLLKQLKDFKHDIDVKWMPGLWLMASGFAKKLLLADRLGVFVDAAFNHPGEATAPQLLVATFFFGFQIYCDFSGYTDIARGISLFFGVDLMKNFNRPYLSRTLADFWRRWHISLSGWFRDYVYYPLGGNREGKWKMHFNLLTVFALSGLWHGANWTFLIWGLWHGFGLVAERIFTGPKPEKNPGIFHFAITLMWVFTGWFFFRVNSWSDILFFKQAVSSASFWTLSDFNLFHSNSELLLSVAGICLLWFWEAIQNKEWLSGRTLSMNLQTLFLIATLFTVLWFGHFKGQDFIYFQF
ncbi:MAG TPA: MBOAT family O-acyltransferase [Catalimonadaceae bacterium]|nr:MBOAT family O-acyltransferase [Catalimonadaceae bacterium]HPI10862.1 MBOAT family O-acyltransferase [Catalimonadaceae bacterium]